MPFGFDRQTWRTVALLTAATIATGVLVGALEYVSRETPEGLTCLDVQIDPSRTRPVAEALAADLDSRGQPRDQVVKVVAGELRQACASRGLSSHPVNSDLKGSISARLEALRRDR
jgi:hypothetical protein